MAILVTGGAGCFRLCRRARFRAVLYRYALKLPLPVIGRSFAKISENASIIRSSASCTSRMRALMYSVSASPYRSTSRSAACSSPFRYRRYAVSSEIMPAAPLPRFFYPLLYRNRQRITRRTDISTALLCAGGITLRSTFSAYQV